MSPGPIFILSVMTSSETSSIQSLSRTAVFRSAMWLSHDASSYPSPPHSSIRVQRYFPSYSASTNSNMSVSDFFGYIPMTSGVQANACMTMNSSVSSSIFRTAFFRITAVHGSI